MASRLFPSDADWSAPLVMSGMNDAIPPVLTGVPGPRRLNHVSRVKAGRFSAVGVPNAT